MTVTASFEFPKHIWLTHDALDSSYPSGIGRLTFDVVMPTVAGPVGGPPQQPGVTWPAPAPGQEVVRWVTEYASFIPESLRPATGVHRIVVTNVDGAVHEDRQWFTPAAQLAEYINLWFDNVRTWVEVVTGQDLDPNHIVYDAEAVGRGLTFLDPDSDGALGLRITTPRVRPLRAEEWARILAWVRDGEAPPLEEILSRDARAAQRRDENRRAIVDVATAIEIVLGRHVRGLAEQLPDKQQKRITERTALGDYIDIAEKAGLRLALSCDDLRWINNMRNDAVHRGAESNNWDAGIAVQRMLYFLGAHGAFRRSEKREVDGSEWIVAEADGASWEDSGDAPASGRPERGERDSE